MKFLISLAIVLLPFLSISQDLPSFKAYVGVNYAPKFLVPQPLGEAYIQRVPISMIPTVDVFLGDERTAFRASLGGVTRLGVVLGYKWAYCAFGYAYTLDLPEQIAHTAEMEIGARIKIGTENRWQVTIGGKVDTAIMGSMFSFSPSIGVRTLINK